MKLTIDPLKTNLYGRIKVGDGGSFESGESLLEAAQSL